MNRHLGAGLAAAAALALAAPGTALAQEPASVQYFFHCAGPGKVQNGTPAQVGTQSWNTTAPTKSFASPDAPGCGFVDFPGPVRPSTVASNAYDAYFTGIHNGAVDKAKVELHSLLTSRVRQGDSMTVNVRIFKASASGEAPLAEKDFTVQPVLSSTGASEKIVVEFTNLKSKIPAAAADRRLWITVHTEAQPQAWVFDASEVPANVVFTEPPPVLPPA